MKRLNSADKVFIVCLMLFLGHQMLQVVAGITIRYIDSYLDPFLMMPVLLHGVTIERQMVLSERAYKLPLSHILGYFILVTVIGEVVFPLLSDKHTADPWDVLFYAAGGLFYVFVQRSASDLGEYPDQLP